MHSEVLLALFEQLALAAARRIREIGPAHAAAKSDGSPVTPADIEAERVILAGLSASATGLPIVAEERCAAGELPTGDFDRFVLVDALDGTREFVSGRSDYTVNIALVEHGAPVAGVVVAPAHSEMFLGGPLGAFRVALGANGASASRHRIGVRDAVAAPRALVSASHCTPETGRFLDRLGIRDRVARGSSLKFCLIAAGEADIYPRLGPTMQWDTAAGDAVLRAAGGRTLQAGGGALAYGQRGGGYPNPAFVAMGNPTGDFATRVLSHFP